MYLGTMKYPYKTVSLMAYSGVGAIFGQECQKRGMLVRVAGDSIMMSPPLTMTAGEVEEVIRSEITALSSSFPFLRILA